MRFNISYVIRMFFACCLYALIFYLYVFICHSYVRRMYSYVIRMSPVRGFTMTLQNHFSFKSGRSRQKNNTAFASCVNGWFPCWLSFLKNHTANFYMKTETEGKSRIISFWAVKASIGNFKNKYAEVIQILSVLSGLNVFTVCDTFIRFSGI